MEEPEIDGYMNEIENESVYGMNYTQWFAMIQLRR